MAEDTVVTTGMSVKDRLKQVAEQRYMPQPLDIPEFGTYYFRRLTGAQLDELARLQAKEPDISIAKYNSQVAAMSLVTDTGTPLTSAEVLELGPAFYNPAREFAMKLTEDYKEKAKKEAGKETDEPFPFLRMPTFEERSAASGDATSSKSTSSPTPSPK